MLARTIGAWKMRHLLEKTLKVFAVFPRSKEKVIKANCFV